MSTLKTGTVQNNSGTGAPLFKNNAGTEIGQLAKAWVHFNGKGTVAISDDFNVESLTDNGTGRYTIHFTTDMSNGNYAVVVGGSDDDESDPPSFFGCAVESFTTSNFNIFTRRGAGMEDSNPICAVVFGA